MRASVSRDMAGLYHAGSRALTLRAHGVELRAVAPFPRVTGASLQSQYVLEVLEIVRRRRSTSDTSEPP